MKILTKCGHKQSIQKKERNKKKWRKRALANKSDDKRCPSANRKTNRARNGNKT